MLHALTSLACAYQVTDGEADHYFHASHILSGVRGPYISRSSR